jgi:hypothetical protein
LNKHKWCYNNKGYAKRYDRVVDGKLKTLYMHTVIVTRPNGMDVDHKDLNPLNNQKYNLRICTRSQNCANKKNQSNNMSGYKGVCFNKRVKRWQAGIKINQKRIHIGTFLNKIEAAKAYNKKSTRTIRRICEIERNTQRWKMKRRIL